MTLLHRLTTAYAIVITSLLLGESHGNARLLDLEKQNPNHSLTETQRVRLVAHITVPYFGAGVLAGLLFVGFTRPHRKQIKIRGAEQEPERDK